MSKLAIWLTPLWIIAVGIVAGATILAAAWGVCWLVNRRAAGAIAAAVNDGVLRYLGYVIITLAILGTLATPAMPLARTISSLKRLPFVQSIDRDVTVPARTSDMPVLAIFRASELQSYSIISEQDIAVNTEEGRGYVEPLIQVQGGEPYQWTPGGSLSRGFDGEVRSLYITNESGSPSNVRIRFETDVETPEVRQIPTAAIGTIAIFLIYLGVRFLAPRTSIIAAATAKETVAQPIYILLTAIGLFALFAYVFIPYNTFGEDVKMLKTTGMTTIKILAILTALWTASASVADEIEGRTALTVLSKPIGRRQFIIGKFLGIVWPIALMFIVLGLWFLLMVSFKVVYDARESARTTPEWQECSAEVVRIVPGLVLSFFESVILAAISVAVSTRLPMMPNLIICGSIYAVGHLAALIVKSSVGVFVQFVGKLISVVLPVLDHFEIEGAIAGASEVPTSYLWWALLYTALYCTAAMLLALVFFEDRDLA